ncbi:hypothetical protein WJ97_12970 [Burkholderia ubonensis]|nr:hypothetical protein WJ97_12970 [Burkholderia ubonensis]
MAYCCIGFSACWHRREKAPTKRGLKLEPVFRSVESSTLQLGLRQCGIAISTCGLLLFEHALDLTVSAVAKIGVELAAVLCAHDFPLLAS